MDDDQRRRNAWNNALHAEGTKAVFDARARSLRRRITVRDFVGIGVPIVLAYVLGSEFLEALRPYREIATGVLAIAALLQILLVLWSLLRHWDEELAYSIHAIRESNSLKDAWVRTGTASLDRGMILCPLFSLGREFADALTRYPEI